VRRVLLPLIALIVAGCSFDYSDARIEGEASSAIPDLEVFDARTVLERDTRIEVRAAVARTWSQEARQEFEDISFREYAPDGTLRLEGSADRAVLDLRTEDLELFGTVNFASRVDDAALESDYLSWDNSERVLVGRPDGTVEILRGDGSRVGGRGLRIDGRRNSLELNEGVSGRLEVADDGDDADDTGGAP